MKKIKSFTLAETIMTLFIVGLVVTASIPMFTKTKSTPNNAATFDKPWGYCDATRQMGLCANVNVPVVIKNDALNTPANGYDLTVRTGLNNYITPYEMFMSDERKLRIGDYIFKEDRTNLMITKNDETLSPAQTENIVIGDGNILNNNFQNSVIIGNNNGDNDNGGSIGQNSTVIGSGNQSGNDESDKTIIGTNNNQNLTSGVAPNQFIGGLLIGNNVTNDNNTNKGIYISGNAINIGGLIMGDTGTLTFNGNVSVHGGISASQLTPSDERLKNIKGSYTKGLKEVLQVEPVIYRYKGQSGKHTGVIAQDLQKVFPEAVVKMPDGYLGVNTDPVFFAMLNAMKEVNQKTQEEEQKQIRLQKELDEIKAELETLTACKNDDFWSKIKCFWYDTKMFFKGLIGAADFGKADRTNVRERRPHEQSYVVKFLRSKNETKFKLCELPIIQEAHGSIVNLFTPLPTGEGVAVRAERVTDTGEGAADRTLFSAEPSPKNLTLVPRVDFSPSPDGRGEETAHGIIVNDYRLNLPCHCEEAQPTKQSRWEKSYPPYGQAGFLVALGMTCSESRLNASCHCKEVLHEEA